MNFKYMAAFITLSFLKLGGSAFASESPYETSISPNLRNLVMHHVAQGPDGFKDLLNSALVSKTFCKDARTPNVWMQFLPRLGLSPNLVHKDGKDLLQFKSPNGETWTVETLLKYLRPLVSEALQNKKNTLLNQWVCYRFVELFASPKYNGELLEVDKAQIALITSALTTAHKITSRPEILYVLEVLSTSAVFDNCHKFVRSMRLKGRDHIVTECSQTLTFLRVKLAELGVLNNKNRSDKQDIEGRLMQIGLTLKGLDYMVECFKGPVVNDKEQWISAFYNYDVIKSSFIDIPNDLSVLEKYLFDPQNKI
jgi:hypothetical protein